MSTNLALAKALADFADALAEYNHLPALSVAAVGVDGNIPARLIHHSPLADLELLAQWADTFGAPIWLDTSNLDREYVTFSAQVEIAARQVTISVIVGAPAFRSIEAGIGDVDEVSVPVLRDAISKAVA